jgi:hypothetical protein
MTSTINTDIFKKICLLVSTNCPEKIWTMGYKERNICGYASYVQDYSINKTLNIQRIKAQYEMNVRY